jgi:hypothetical protein
MKILKLITLLELLYKNDSDLNYHTCINNKIIM